MCARALHIRIYTRIPPLAPPTPGAPGGPATPHKVTIQPKLSLLESERESESERGRQNGKTKRDAKEERWSPKRRTGAVQGCARDKDAREEASRRMGERGSCLRGLVSERARVLEEVAGAGTRPATVAAGPLFALPTQ